MFRIWAFGLIFGLMACSGGDGSTNEKGTDTEDTALPTCMEGCTTSADCDMGSSAYDADNYECRDGACEWTGCNSNEECESVVAGWICTESTTGPNSCVDSCTTAADCDMGSAPFDTDNYECRDGGCQWTGCNTNEECTSVFGANYACADSGLDVNTCLMTCETQTDCTQGLSAFDEDNYECRDGTCAWTGCNSDQECAEDFAGNVCR